MGFFFGGKGGVDLRTMMWQEIGTGGILLATKSKVESAGNDYYCFAVVGVLLDNDVGGSVGVLLD